MAVLSSVLSDESGSMDGAFNRTYRQVWTVVVSTPNESITSILLSGTVPLPNASFPADTVAIALKPEVTIPDRGNPYVRQVSVEYSTRPPSDPERQSQNSAESPVLRPPDVRWGHVVGTELFTESADTTRVKKVVNGTVTGDASMPGEVATKPITVSNSAGEVPDPAPEKQVRRLTLTVTRNEANFDPNSAESYMDAVNNDVFQGFPAGDAQCVQFDGQRGYERGVRFWIVTYGFEFGFWDFDMRDAGSYSIDASGGSGNEKRVPGVVAGGVPMPRVNLNGAGGPLAVAAAPVYLRFRRYHRKAFAPLNLTNL